MVELQYMFTTHFCWKIEAAHRLARSNSTTLVPAKRKGGRVVDGKMERDQKRGIHNNHNSTQRHKEQKIMHREEEYKRCRVARLTHHTLG